MSDKPTSENELGQVSRQERMSALFASWVVQQTNMAFMLLGRVPHPETGESIQDLDGARLFIDQLEMMECKTKGNLDPREDQLLKQSLMSLRMAFVETVESTPGNATAAAGRQAPPQPAASKPTLETATPGAPEEEESRKKFSKKY